VLHPLKSEVLPNWALPAGIAFQATEEFVVFRTCDGIYRHRWTPQELLFVKHYKEYKKKNDKERRG
jgi:hypothetical protein